jgi:dTDP-glucose pyrophosphorylase
MKVENKHTIHHSKSLKDALSALNDLTYVEQAPLVLLVIDETGVLKGTLTDGDIRRSLVKGKGTETSVVESMNKDFRFLTESKYGVSDLQKLKQEQIWSIPILDSEGRLIQLINLKNKLTILPIDAVIMAGGKGQRLYPLTKDVPKPMLKVGGKPIIEINIDRMIKSGIQNINVSVNYLANVIINYFTEEQKECNLKFVQETEPMGTVGSITLVNEIMNDYILLMNSDLLTDINFEDFFTTLKDNSADMIVASVSHRVSVPYAVFEVDGLEVKKLVEKPTYSYHSNAGIYLLKKEMLKYVPQNTFFNATDLLEKLIEQKHKVIYYDLVGYWLDIGSPQDFEKAQKDVLHLNL